MPSSGARNDPVPAFRFTVRFDDFPPGGFTDVTGLQMEAEVQDFREGGRNGNTLKFVTRVKQSANLVCKRGIVDKNLWDWFQEIARGTMRFRNGSVIVHDDSGTNDLLEYHVLQAFPVKWSASDLGAMQNAVAVETVEFAHQGVERIR